MNRAPGWLEALLRQLEAEAPADALLLAPPAHPLAATLRARLPACEWTGAAPDALPARRFALAIAVATLEALPADAARALLARLRDFEARHVLLWLELSRAPLGETDLRALGFRLHARDADAALFGFDLYDYKERPEWLSPDRWAHPELWDKFRW